MKIFSNVFQDISFWFFFLDIFSLPHRVSRGIDFFKCKLQTSLRLDFGPIYSRLVCPPSHAFWRVRKCWKILKPLKKSTMEQFCRVTPRFSQMLKTKWTFIMFVLSSRIRTVIFMNWTEIEQFSLIETS